jgi:radical SAM protein with 4Fe4S-binding SPASM domain
MPFELWKKCADQVAQVAPETQCWFSFCGEPLLEPELLLRMLAYGQVVGLRSLNINTNGMLLVPALAERILDSGADLIVFGVDGFSQATYEKLRCRARRDTVYANIEHFLARRQARGSGPEVQVQFIEMPENQHELEPFKQFWLDRGAQLKIRHMMSWGGQYDTPLHIPPEERIPCPWGLTMMHVFWDGRVPQCSGDVEGEAAVGNAWEEPLSVLWGRLAEFHRKHLEHRFDELPERCHRCKDWMTGAASKIRPH